MNRLSRRALLGAAASVPASLAAAPAFAKEGEGRRYRYPTRGHRIDWGGAIIRVKAPMEAVMDQVLEYNRYNQLLPRMETSKVLGRSSDSAQVYLRAPILRGLASVWGVTKFQGPLSWKWGGQKVVASLVRGNVRQFMALWKVHPCPDHTVLRLELLLDPKIPVPASVVTDQLMWAADVGVTALRKQVETHYTA